MARESQFYVECLDGFSNESMVTYLEEKRGHIPKERIFDSEGNDHLVYPVEYRDVTFFQETKKSGMPLRFNVYRIRNDGHKSAELWKFHTKTNLTAEHKRVQKLLNNIQQERM
ncbi:MAG: hypothetical protein WCT18_02745 [Patescibacteria group bacterium]